MFNQLFKEKERSLPGTFEELVQTVKEEFAAILRVNVSSGPFSEKERVRRMKKREEMRDALRNCGTGDDGYKIFVKDYIKRILIEKLSLNEENINCYLKEDAEYRFKLMLNELKEKQGSKAFEFLINEYINPLTNILESGEISAENIDAAYYEYFSAGVGFPKKLEYLSQKIYENYKGNGAADELLGMALDGISGGVSGNRSSYPVWMMYKGNTIKLSFLKFSGEKEIKRICRNLCKGYGIGQVSEKKGFVVAEMKDGSRVSIARPPFSESWVFFIRKFKMDRLLEVKDIIKGAGREEVILLLKYLVLGERLTCISGEQGSGKTSLLAAMIDFIPKYLNIRVSEMSFELHLRRRFPDRNIVSFKETESVGIQEGLDYSKKTDGNVTIIGEVAGMQAVIFLVQVAQNASSFTLFTHHAKDTKSLIHYFRNALLMQAGFKNERIALMQAVSAININIRLGKSRLGERYIEKISEIIPDEGEEGFTENVIMVRRGNSYVRKNELSRETKEEIFKRLEPEDRISFLELLKNW